MRENHAWRVKITRYWLRKVAETAKNGHGIAYATPLQWQVLWVE
jgi:hypothetical protein